MSFFDTYFLVHFSVKTLTFYISITQHGVVKKRKSLALFERSVILIIWAFYVTCDASSFSAKGFGGVRGPIQLYVSAGFLLFVSIIFAVYGVQIIRRLETIETMATQQVIFASQTETYRSIDYSSEEAHAVLEEVKRRPPKPADRIRKVLLVTEISSLLCVGALVRVALMPKYQLDLLFLIC